MSESSSVPPQGSAPIASAGDAASRPSAAEPRRRLWLERLREPRVVVVVVVLLIGALGLWWWRSGRVTTDNAKIEGVVRPISPRVGGQVVAVHVEDNQPVRQGETLFELDDRDFLVALRRAEADLAVAEAAAQGADVGFPVASASASSRLEVAQAMLQAAITGVRLAEREGEVAAARARSVAAGLEEARAQAGQTQRDLERLRPLAEKDEISRRELDAAETAASAAAARVERLAAEAGAAEHEVAAAAERLAQARGQEQRARAELDAAETAPQQIEASRAEVTAARARVEQARAAVERARLDLEYSEVRAPADGLITMKSVEVGQLVQPGRPLLAIVDLDDVWVEAKYKETQLDRMRPGQPARIAVDAYPGLTLRGRVDSVAAATSARFSLFPAENATGNFVKVVQRVPVKIVLETPPERPLRPGMSVVVTVLVRGEVVEGAASPAPPSAGPRTTGAARDEPAGDGTAADPPGSPAPSSAPPPASAPR